MEAQRVAMSQPDMVRLAAGIGRMSWWQGVATIAAGSSLVVIPLVLTAHPGTRYGIPFPVLLRSSFGINGAHIPALLRALVACGWCGIETWIGGQTIALLLPFDRQSWYSHRLSWLGTSPLDITCFFIFMLCQLALIWKGMAHIRRIQNYSAPVLIILTGALFYWAYHTAGGFGDMLSLPSRKFWPIFLPSLTASAANWSGLALNISDFSRYARSQTSQITGQLGLPLFMAAYCFAGLAIASATETIFGRVISDPVELLREIGGVGTAIVALFGISLAIVTTNIPANLVAPANFLVSLRPGTFSFARGAAATALVSVAFLPWKILGSSESFVYTWLVGYSMVLGPITGIMIVDYYVLRGMVLDVKGLYSGSPVGRYYYWGGYNVAALVALVVAVVLAVPGFLHKAGVVETTPGMFVAIYDNAWLFGIFCGGLVYWVLSCGRELGKGREGEPLAESLNP